MLGTIGESMRMEGTVISDAVNVASRLEGLSKVLAVQIVVSEALLASLDQCPTGIRRLGCIRVKGKAMHIEAVEIFEGAAPKEYRAKLQTLEIFHEAMTAFHAEDWEKASHLFAQVMKLNPLDQTCQFYMDCVERRNKDLFRVLDHDRAG